MKTSREFPVRARDYQHENFSSRVWEEDHAYTADPEGSRQDSPPAIIRNDFYGMNPQLVSTLETSSPARRRAILRAMISTRDSLWGPAFELVEDHNPPRSLDEAQSTSMSVDLVRRWAIIAVLFRTLIQNALFGDRYFSEASRPLPYEPAMRALQHILRDARRTPTSEELMVMNFVREEAPGTVVERRMQEVWRGRAA